MSKPAGGTATSLWGFDQQQTHIPRFLVQLHYRTATDPVEWTAIAVECPFCGAWEDAHTLQHDGGECGAAVRMELTFEKSE